MLKIIKIIKNMKIPYKTILLALFLGVVVFLAIPGKADIADKIFGSAAQLNPKIRAQASVVVGTQEVKTLFSSRDLCGNRVVSTAGQAIMLTFDGSAPTGSAGHIQAASTTVAYAAETFGCGVIKAYGQIASTTITTSEFDY